MTKSEESAERFLAARRRRERRAERQTKASERRQSKTPRGRAALAIPEGWRFVEKRVPGCYAAWVATVGLPMDGIQLGENGGRGGPFPPTVNATDERCYRPGHTACRCYRFRDGVWTKRVHPLVVCCARHVIGDGMHADDCPVPR